MKTYIKSSRVDKPIVNLMDSPLRFAAFKADKVRMGRVEIGAERYISIVAAPKVFDLLPISFEFFTVLCSYNLSSVAPLKSDPEKSLDARRAAATGPRVAESTNASACWSSSMGPKSRASKPSFGPIAMTRRTACWVLGGAALHALGRRVPFPEKTRINKNK